MQKDILISINDVYKTYHAGAIDTPVLKGISFDVYKGEFICILGESGSGKSTMLNIIGGLVNADSGSIKFNGKEIIALSEKDLTLHRRDNIGYIFQNYNRLPNLNAKQNLDIIAELTNSSADSEEMLELVGLGDKIKSYPSQLSGGQQQRVSIARALIKNPILVLADEPTAALDCATSKEVLEVFETVVKRGTTLVVVTHNENITKMANRIIRLRNGTVYETIENDNPIKAKDLEW